MQLADAQGLVDEYIKSFKEGYFPAHTNLIRLMEEVGELAKEFNHNFGPLKKQADSSADSLEEELGDVLFSTCVLANQLNIDLERALKNVIEKYRLRDSKRWTPK